VNDFFLPNPPEGYYNKFEEIFFLSEKRRHQHKPYSNEPKKATMYRYV